MTINTEDYDGGSSSNTAPTFVETQSEPYFMQRELFRKAQPTKGLETKETFDENIFKVN